MDATTSDARLWEAVARRRCAGLRFRRRQRIGSYVAPLYCPAADLVVVVDEAMPELAPGQWALRLPADLIESASADRLRRAILEAIVERPLESATPRRRASRRGSSPPPA